MKDLQQKIYINIKNEKILEEVQDNLEGGRIVVLTDQNLYFSWVTTSGMFSKKFEFHVRSWSIDSIKSLHITRVGLGTSLDISSSQGTHSYEFTIPSRKNLDKLTQTLTNIKLSPHPSQSTISKSTSQLSIPDLIAQLANLKKHGVITEEEFEIKKKELLSRL